MNTSNFGFFPRFALLVAITLGLAVSTGAQTEMTLHSFANDADGYNPVASLVSDRYGNLYSTTSEGGSFTGCSTGCGVIFELSLVDGAWIETVPYTFAGRRDGANPLVGLTPDGSGNFYGATGDGGNTLGSGTIFRLSPKAGGGWNKTLVHVFTGGLDGAHPYGNLILDSAGNLYGTAHNGGNQTCDCGVVFEMSPTSGGGWKETLLHAFNAKNGAFPSANLIFDSAGNLYGTTTFGGPSCTSAVCGSGLVFELLPISGGGWKESVLYSFLNSTDGGFPVAGLVFDKAGNLYGTTQQAGNTGVQCGASGCGVVFELSPKPGGGWTESTLHAFNRTDGQLPLTGLAFDPSGNLYGTTYKGGSFACGVVFKLSPASGGGWTESTTYNFMCGNDGGFPQSSLITDSAGNVYGTTQYGGANGRGTVFEIVP